MNEKGLIKTDLGGYEDTALEPLPEVRENWNMVITRQSPAEITLEARKLLQNGCLKLQRRLTIKQGDPSLYLRYTIANQSQKSICFPWRARLVPGVGFARDAGQGNPWEDEVWVPGVSGEPIFSFRPEAEKVSSRRCDLPEGIVLCYDRFSKTALVVLAPVGSGSIYYSTDSAAGSYFLLYSNASEDCGLTIPPGGAAVFELQLIGLFGVSHPDEVIRKWTPRR